MGEFQRHAEGVTAPPGAAKTPVRGHLEALAVPADQRVVILAGARVIPRDAAVRRGLPPGVDRHFVVLRGRLRRGEGCSGHNR